MRTACKTENKTGSFLMLFKQFNEIQCKESHKFIEKEYICALNKKQNNKL